jgi:hypothetical protein
MQIEVSSVQMRFLRIALTEMDTWPIAKDTLRRHPDCLNQVVWAATIFLILTGASE